MRLRRLLCSLLLCSATPALAAADADANLEYRLRAAFLLNFAKFVSWTPEQFATDSSPLDFCLQENDPVVTALEEAARGKQIESRTLRVRRLAAPLRWEGCHVVYIGAQGVDQAAQVFADLSGKPVLTVHESGQTLPGGVIRLFVEERKLRFEVNTAAAERGALRLSSKLMSLALLVHV